MQDASNAAANVSNGTQRRRTRWLIDEAGSRLCIWASLCWEKVVRPLPKTFFLCRVVSEGTLGTDLDEGEGLLEHGASLGHQRYTSRHRIL